MIKDEDVEKLINDIGEYVQDLNFLYKYCQGLDRAAKAQGVLQAGLLTSGELLDDEKLQIAHHLRKLGYGKQNEQK